MKRIIIYSAVLLVLLTLEALLSMGEFFIWANYNLIGCIAQGLVLTLCLGAAEHWSREWIKEDK